MLVPTVLAKIYGIEGGMRVFSVGFCFAGFGSLINTVLLSVLLTPLQYEGLTIVYNDGNKCNHFCINNSYFAIKTIN